MEPVTWVGSKQEGERAVQHFLRALPSTAEALLKLHTMVDLFEQRTVASGLRARLLCLTKC
jgi:hypothetical protein